MCGRFTLRTPTPVLVRRFQLELIPELIPRYNIAPTQEVVAVRSGKGEAAAKRELAMFRWGLIPSWAKDPRMGAKMINARAESVAEKPAFRTAFLRRRCLVLADGYYEWRAAGGKKQPYYIRSPEDEPLAFAGLWERWRGIDGPSLETCTIITTDASATTRPIHDRMPVILHEADYDQWLDPREQVPERLTPLLRPFDGPLQIDRVSPYVNKPANDSAQCIEVQAEFF